MAKPPSFREGGRFNAAVCPRGIREGDLKRTGFPTHPLGQARTLRSTATDCSPPMAGNFLALLQ